MNWSADFQIGAIMPGFSNTPIWKSALHGELQLARWVVGRGESVFQIA